MNRFIAVERKAAHEIISDRMLQSIEFEAGLVMSQILKDPNLEAEIDVAVQIVHRENGLFFVPNSEISNDFLVFDLETSGLFDRTQSDADALLCFQKVLRFAVKSWNGLRLSATERPLQNSSKIIVWPYPISLHTSFRISIETSPDSARQSKRTGSGRCFLAYRSGTDEGLGPKEEASTSNFRRFLEDRRGLRHEPKRATATAASINALSVTSLDALITSKQNPYQGYDRWLALLTSKQKLFVLSTLSAPHRIEGPAGTGKTISLVLKAIAGLKAAIESETDHRAIFITHSEATRKTVQQLFEANYASGLLSEQPLKRRQSLKVTTLQQLCGEILQREISETEFIDRDAMGSKQMQVLYVNEAVEGAIKSDYFTYKRIMSAEFREFLESTERWKIAEMVQHEISVVIKGRADEKLENYRKLPRLKYGLPIVSAQDRGFVWTIFKKYQSQLQTSAQFDTDDIVLTTIGQLDTPIWRRRRTNDGYDGIYIDETHLFNVNELSLFHHLTRSILKYPITYSVDRSQAIGDRDWSDDLFESTLSPDEEQRRASSHTKIDAIFRCSPDIVNLAFAVTSSGATLFTNFDDPLKSASSVFTAEDERKCALPCSILCNNDDEMIITGFARADALCKDIQVSRGDVALIVFSDELFGQMETYAVQQNKPVEILKERGDIEVVQRAERSGRFVLSTPEYIGGLEFDAVVLVGVDDGRVPPTRTLETIDSSNFLTYAAHNRLYVSITRARYRVEILAAKERGLSPLLRNAVASGALKDGNC